MECFVAVGEQGSIAGAAAALMLSPSAITGALNELERAFNAQLTIRRKAHGVSLTPSGQYVLSQARGLLHAATDLQVMAADAGKTLRGKVVIGCYSSLAPTLLTELMAEYGNRHPDVELDFFAGTQQEIHEKLLSGELDLAIAYDLTVPPGLTRKRLREAVPVVVLPADHPLAALDTVALAELVDEPMILLDVNPSRENTEMMFSAAELTPWIRFRTTDFEVTRSMVARGMGYAILVQRPAVDVSYEGRPLVVRQIHPAVRHVPISMVWSEGVRLSRSAEAMLELSLELHRR
ncbi:LysR family transcriptional regulator [Paeniglutamicibacter sulfureus]|uniref:DNA-binding transcriptional LysR family regulator n=1 Tax=Paeniglutamicibacter sulfureus TaxID=43666 RepID=A0ABU2BG64_9MICC|nr:LysR family transcriptional regulator [Paeniglutamicibacter sulfureus]MDO2933292.1 LysR family transcriptional regulator [Paeniglutamicibacter sulfureus]MDR7357603.1 DNA-binding transcriptional LysR family regulator [Paeniglutamicibacter sulfureus]